MPRHSEPHSILIPLLGLFLGGFLLFGCYTKQRDCTTQGGVLVKGPFSLECVQRSR